MLWGVAAAALGAVLASALWLGRVAPSVPSCCWCSAAPAGGVLGRDWWLTQRSSRREERMLAEFPVVAELLALAVTAGEGATGGARPGAPAVPGRAGRRADARCLARARAGRASRSALQGLADRTGLDRLARFVDGLIVAIERGTPLAEVLRAQAADVREAGKRRPLEAGGRKEIAMMVPVVFLVLPVTVLFALYPGLSLLRFSM